MNNNLIYTEHKQTELSTQIVIVISKKEGK